MFLVFLYLFQGFSRLFCTLLPKTSRGKNKFDEEGRPSHLILLFLHVKPSIDKIALLDVEL